jgi:hypothetical protein
MPCTFCTSGNQREFPAEVNIHLSGLRNSQKPGVFVFPRLLVCLDCGASSFMTPPSELAELCAADEPLPDRTAPVSGIGLVVPPRL